MSKRNARDVWERAAENHSPAVLEDAERNARLCRRCWAWRSAE